MSMNRIYSDLQMQGIFVNAGVYQNQIGGVSLQGGRRRRRRNSESDESGSNNVNRHRSSGSAALMMYSTVEEAPKKTKNKSTRKEADKTSVQSFVNEDRSVEVLYDPNQEVLIAATFEENNQEDSFTNIMNNTRMVMQRNFSSLIVGSSSFTNSRRRRSRTEDVRVASADAMMEEEIKARQRDLAEVKKDVVVENFDAIVSAAPVTGLVLHSPVKKKDTTGPIKSNYLRKRKTKQQGLGNFSAIQKFA